MPDILVMHCSVQPARQAILTLPAQLVRSSLDHKQAKIDRPSEAGGIASTNSLPCIAPSTRRYHSECDQLIPAMPSKLPLSQDIDMAMVCLREQKNTRNGTLPRGPGGFPPNSRRLKPLVSGVYAVDRRNGVAVGCKVP
jgi:hypothetical protein